MKFNEERVEQIARRYCELKGENPEDVMVSGVTRLQQIIERIKDEWTLDSAAWGQRSIEEDHF